MNITTALTNKKFKIVKIYRFKENLERLGLSENVLCFIPFKFKKTKCVIANGKVVVMENLVAENVVVEYV